MKGRTYTWKADFSPSPRRIMRGMGLRPADLEGARKRVASSARRDVQRTGRDATRTRRPAAR